MKILIAPDSFKECMSSKEVAIAIKNGLKKVLNDVEYEILPMADGGEGTIDSLVYSTNASIIKTITKDPLGNDIKSQIAISDDNNTAIIEMASTNGLELVPKDKRNPLITTTFGTGQLIKKALDFNIKTIIIGIGGSATNDGGAGMIQALGGKLLDKNNNQIKFGGKYLKKLVKIDLSNLDKRLKDTKIIVACDVKNPLTGVNGASYVFAKQKGANDSMIKELDENLEHFSKIIKDQLKIDIKNVKGAGAAGGLGGGLMAFLNADLKQGIDLIIKYNSLEEKIKNSDLIITAEGSIDSQTKFGKTPYGVAKIAKKYDKPVIAITANIIKDEKILSDCNFDCIFSIIQNVDTLENSIKNGKENLEWEAFNIAKLLKIKFRTIL